MTGPGGEKQGTLPSAIFLAVKIIQSKICLGNFCVIMKIASFGSIRTIRGPKPPQFKFNNMVNKNFPRLFFFSKVFFRMKLARWII